MQLTSCAWIAAWFLHHLIYQTV